MLDVRIAAYDEAWNAPDDGTRRSLLEESLTPDAELVDPTAGSIHTNSAGELIHQGIDIVERAEDGRLKRVIMFFGGLPPAEP